MLSLAVGYAASALGYIASAAPKSVLVKEVAQACQIPAPYLAKIVHMLSKNGIVLTQRGIGGGVMLARPASELNLLELCRAMNDPIIQSRCMLGSVECSDDRACPAHEFWKVQRAEQLDFLGRTTIADIASFESRRRAGKAEGGGNGGGGGGGLVPLGREPGLGGAGGKRVSE